MDKVIANYKPKLKQSTIGVYVSAIHKFSTDNDIPINSIDDVIANVDRVNNILTQMNNNKKKIILASILSLNYADNNKLFIHEFKKKHLKCSIRKQMFFTREYKPILVYFN